MIPYIVLLLQYYVHHIHGYTATVSGLSSGGFMAVQFHVAHSSSISGAAIIAGGPFYCAMDNVAIAVSSCMTQPSLINVNQLVTITYTTYTTTLTIDNPTNMKHDNIFLFSGKDDTTVVTGVVTKLYNYYTHFLSSNNPIEYVNNIDTVHAFVTDFYGNPCKKSGPPYIVNCDYDLAGKFLSKLYPGLKPLSNTTTGSVITIDQSKFLPVGYTLLTAGLNKYAYAYIPHGCEWKKGTHCKPHIAFHGCQQSVGVIGMAFIEHTGYNFYAETNDLIIIYPQTQNSSINPNGCWDWWGYTGTAYASKLGAQIATIHNIIKSVF